MYSHLLNDPHLLITNTLRFSTIDIFPFLLADAYRIGRRIDEGIAAIDQALGLTDELNARWWEAEMHRLKGRLLLRKSRGDRTDDENLRQAAGACFSRAIRVAEDQEGGLPALRAARWMNRRLCSQNRLDEVVLQLENSRSRIEPAAMIKKGIVPPHLGTG